MKKTHLIAAGVLVLVLSLYSYTSTRATGGQIEMCVKRSGLVYVIGDGFRRSECRDNATLVSWNSEGTPGPQGPAGPAGAAGAQGPAGSQGPAGEDGEDGAQGPAGADGANGTDGADGAQGPQGPAGSGGGWLNLYLRNTDVLMQPGTSVVLYADCDAGDQVISGGFAGPGFSGIVIQQSLPWFPSQWRIDATHQGPPIPRTLTAYAWCHDVAP